MRRFSHFHYLFFLLFVASLLFLPSSLVLAQEGKNPSLRITKIDAEDYPDVKVYLDGRNLPANLSKLPLTLSENGQEVSIANSAMVAQGTQTAFVLDASGSIQDPGVTGKFRYEEVQSVVDRFIIDGYLENSTDWLSAYAPNQKGEVTSIQDWTQDHNAVRNELYLYQYPPVGVVTELFNLIYFAVDKFESSRVPSHLSRSIVLFSDGYAGEGSLRLDDAINRAIKANVVIHTVMLGEETQETSANMKRMATLTGGKYVQITSEDALDPLWDHIIGKREQRQLNYRSQLAEPRELLVSATLPNGERIQAAKAFSSISISGVEVEILEPRGEFIINKEAPAHDTPVQELDPKSINIQVSFNWVDGYPRNLTQVEYMINDYTLIRSEEPFDEFTFPIENLESGGYTIRVVASDELGLKGEAQPFSFDVQVNRPAAAASAEGAPSGQASWIWLQIPGSDPIRIRQDMARNVASMMALLLAVLAVIIAMRNPVRRKQVTEAFSSVLKQVTQPFFPNRDDMKPKPVKALLTVIQGDDKLPPSIEIRGANTKLGRSPDLANIVIDDPRVSRYHCRITEEADGKFCIWDEGSTSGTYLNTNPVDLKGKALNTGDLINLGPIQFQFRYVGPQNEEESSNYVSGPKPDLNGSPNEKEKPTPVI